MGRKKDSPALAEAKRLFSDITDEYRDILRESKSILKAFFGRKGVSIATEITREQVSASADVTFTKAGKLTMSKEARKDENTIREITGNVQRWSDSIVSSDLPSDLWSTDVRVKDALVSAAKAAPPAAAKAMINRRIDALRRFFGDDSAYVADLHKALVDAGVKVSAKHRILDGNLDQLWEALKVTPKLKDEIAEAIKDISGEDIHRKEMKEHVKAVLKSPSTSKAVAGYYSVLHASVDAYTEALQEFYYTKPGDETTDAYADYLDVLDELKHPSKRLSTAEIEENLRKMAQFIGAGLAP